jgi:DUF438 domain-containing protein
MYRKLDRAKQQNYLILKLSNMMAFIMMIDLETVMYVVENLNIGIVVIDNDEKIILFNRVAGEMLQQDPVSRIGSSIFRCHGEISEDPVAKMISDLKSGVIDHYEGWVNFRGRMLYEYIYPLWDAQGKCLGVVEELHDAAEKAGYLKMKGDWKEIHISGLGEKAPRSSHEQVI